MFYCEIYNEWMDCWNNCEDCEFWQDSIEKE